MHNYAKEDKMRKYYVVKFVVMLGFFSLMGCMTPFQSVKYPEPSADYQPIKKFKLPYEKIFDITEQVMEDNNISIIKSDRQRKTIISDYKPGDVKLRGLGMLGIIQHRYKYKIKFDNSDKANMNVNISCIVESSMAGMNSWNDVTSENIMLANQMQDWLYEQIEKSVSNL